MNNEAYILLVKLTKALTENNIKYWLDGGTLLGIYRQKELISYDSDMDIGLYEESFEGDNPRKIIEIMNNLNWFETDTYSHKLKFRYNNSDITIDMFNFRKTVNFYFHYGFSGYTFYKRVNLDLLEKFNCNGDIFNIPNKPEIYLEDIYGITWKYNNPNFKKPRDYQNYVKNFNSIPSQLKRKIVIFDVDGTLTDPRQIITTEIKDYLVRMSQTYNIFILGAGSCKRIYNQLAKTDNIVFYGNYGLESAIGCMGEIKYIYNEKTKNIITKDMIEAFNKIRHKYNLTEYIGDSYEVHPTGMITFALLGTDAKIKDKLEFDPDKIKRENIWPILKELLPEYNIIIGGTSSFDVLPKNIDKTYGISKILSKYNKYSIKELYFVGDDWHKYGNDYAILKTGIRCFRIDKLEDTKKLMEFFINYRMTLDNRPISWEIKSQI